jgi:uncharacterized membrane protein
MTYLSAANQKSLDARYRLAVVIVAALGLSTLLYILIGWAFAPALPHGEHPWLNSINLAILVFVSVLALLAIRRLFLSPKRLQVKARSGINSVLGSLYLASLSGAVLGDVVGIFGVVGSLMTGIREYSWRLGIAALMMIAYSFPRRSEWEQAVAMIDGENASEDFLSRDAIKLGLSEPND